MTTRTAPSLRDTKPSFVRLGPTTLAYRTVGEGPPLLLVHGYPLSGLTFRGIVPALATRFTCYVPDLPGAGETECGEATDFGFTGQAQTLRRFVDALGLSSYSVVAHDTGATIARKMVVDDAGRLSRFVMIGTEIPHHRPPWIRLYQHTSRPEHPGLLQFLLARRWFRRSSAGFGGCFYDASRIEGEFYDLFVAPLVASRERASRQIRYLRGIDWAVVDAMADLHRAIVAPTLLVWGAEDEVFPVARAAQMTKQLPSCEGLVVIEKAKLFVHEERPEEVSRVALDFLTRGTRNDLGRSVPGGSP